jgi:hypothetical protein
MRDLIGREPCCDEDYGGSHYHCSQCNGVCSMMGHWTDKLWVRGKGIPLPPKPDGSPWWTCEPEYQRLRDEALAAAEDSP